jgi:hypothetical protein
MVLTLFDPDIGFELLLCLVEPDASVFESEISFAPLLGDKTKKI